MNYSKILENELPDILDKLVGDINFDCPWIIAGGSVANKAINYLFNENLPINDIDTYMFNGQGKEKLGIDEVLAEQLDYEQQTIFDWMDFAVGPIEINDLYELIPVSFSLLGKVDFDDVTVPYFLHTFPLNCEKIAYNPITRKIIYSKTFLEFLNHRQILFNPIHVDTDVCLFRALRKHEQGVGRLSSNYVRRIFADQTIIPPNNTKYDPQFEKLKIYSFVYQPKNVRWLQIDPLSNHVPINLDNIHLTVAFENERMFYNAQTLKQAQEIIQANKFGLFYLIASIVEPEFLRQPVSVPLKNKIKGYPESLNDLFAQCLLAPSLNDVFSLIDGFFNFNERYMMDLVVPKLVNRIAYGIKSIFIEATAKWHEPITFWKFKHQIKSMAELGNLTNDFWYFGELLSKRMYTVGKGFFKSPKLERNEDKLKGAYETSPKLYFFTKIIDPNNVRDAETPIPF